MKDAIISIAAGSSQEALIRRIKERGFSVIGVDINPKAHSFKFCDECLIESTHNAEAIIEKLEKLRIKWNFRGIITQSSGLPVITAAKIAEHFNLRYVSPNIAEIVTDKGQLISTLNAKDIPAPKINIISTKGVTRVNFSPPFFVKPSVCFKTHTAMTKVEKYSSLQQAIKKSMEVSETGRVNVEQFIDGVDILSIDWVYNRKIIHVATMKEITSGEPYFYGLGWKIPLTEELEKIAKKIQKQFIDALDINYSLVQTAMKFDGEKAYIIEVHLDLGGDGIPEVLLPYSLNYDLLNNAINLSIGEPPQNPHISPIPTYLRFILKSEIKGEPVKMFKYIKDHFNGTPVEFNGLIASMNDELRIGAIIFQSPNIEELNLRVEKFESWLKTKEIP
ncbi:MAG: ATP-grasp domain-containing protein [Candidatus Helarchaeota archaeon]